MVSKITAGDTLDGNYGVIALESEEEEEGKSNFIVDWFGSRSSLHDEQGTQWEKRLISINHFVLIQKPLI